MLYMSINGQIIGRSICAWFTTLLLAVVVWLGSAAAGTASGNGSSAAFSPSFKQIADICDGPFPGSGADNYGYYTLDKTKLLRVLASQNPDVALEVFKQPPGEIDQYLRQQILGRTPPPPTAGRSSGQAKKSPGETEFDGITGYLQITPVVAKNQQNLDTVNFFIIDGNSKNIPNLYDLLHDGTIPIYCGLPHQVPPPVADTSPPNQSTSPPALAATPKATPAVSTIRTASAPRAGLQTSSGAQPPPPSAPALSREQATPTWSSWVGNGASSGVTSFLKPIKARSSGMFMVGAADFGSDGADANNPSADRYAYSSDKGVSIGLQQTASNAKQLTDFTGALGVDLIQSWEMFPSLPQSQELRYFAFVPFVAANRTQAAGKVTTTSAPTPLPNLTNNTQDWGAVFGWKLPWGSNDKSIGNTNPQYFIVNLIYDNETDNLLHNKFGTTEALITPFSNSFLPFNLYCARTDDGCNGLSALPDVRGEFFAGNVRALTIIDFRMKYIDYYEVKNLGLSSVDSRLFHDAFRVGGQIGEAVEFDFVPDYPLTLSYTYTDYLGLTGFHKDMGLAEYTASLTLNSTLASAPKISFSFDRGRRDDTTAPYLAWTLGLSLKL
jgi:hypothetical protein